MLKSHLICTHNTTLEYTTQTIRVWRAEADRQQDKHTFPPRREKRNNDVRYKHVSIHTFTPTHSQTFANQREGGSIYLPHVIRGACRMVCMLHSACRKQPRGVRRRAHVVVQLRFAVVSGLEVLEVVRRDHMPPPNLVGVNHLASELDVPCFFHPVRGVGAKHAHLGRGSTASDAW